MFLDCGWKTLHPEETHRHRVNISLVLDTASTRDVRINPLCTHPVDEKGLGEFDNFQGDQKTDGNQIVEQDYEGEEV